MSKNIMLIIRTNEEKGGLKGRKVDEKGEKAPPLYEPGFLGAHSARLRYAMQYYDEREAGSRDKGLPPLPPSSLKTLRATQDMYRGNGVLAGLGI